MNLLFLSISKLPHMSGHSIYVDLLHEFLRNGHNIFVVCALDVKEGLKTNLSVEDNCKIVRVKTGNNSTTNLIQKGLTAVNLPKQYIAAIKQYFSDVTFDLVLYPTPPITHVETVKYIKQKDHAKTYLLLKDIFPQNAVDLGMMSKSGLKSIIYRYFRNKEKELYAVSDWIGCMSQANVDYVLKQNPEIDPGRVEVCPNSIEVFDKSVNDETRNEIRTKYGIPLDKKVFIYGGNLGKPQGIPFLMQCLEKCRNVQDAYFFVVGNGTEFRLLEKYAKEANQANFKLAQRLPKEDYDTLVAACDVGMIFLDHRFTIPNFPSRLLGYMQAKLPVLAVTDPNTDIGKVIVDGGFGWWCESNDSDKFCEVVKGIIHSDLNQKRDNAYNYLLNHYTVEICYNTIMNRIRNRMGT